MLKIKDDIDLKELEKYGFKLTDKDKYYSIIYTYYPLGDSQPSERNYLSINLETRKLFNSIWGITWQGGNDHYGFEFSEVLYDLIRDDLVEKVDENNEDNNK